MSVHFTSHRQNWKTPKAFYRELDKEFNFNFDPCPPNPQFNGLEIEWGGCNFVNPPYNECAAWLEKGFIEWQKGKVVVFLIPSRTDTRFWHDFCMQATEIRFIKGRLKFDDQKNSAPFPSALVIFDNQIKASALVYDNTKTGRKQKMGIENDLKRIADALETVAAHLTGNKTITTAAPELAAAVVDDPLAVPAKRGRPRKEEQAAEATPAPAVTAAPTEKITEQVLREELRQFIVRHETKGKNKGMEAAADLLKKFNAKTVSTIKPEDYAAIVEHCRKDKASHDAASKK